MSGGALDYVHSDIRYQVIEKIEHGDVAFEDGGVDDSEVAWDVDETIGYLDDLAGLLKAYEWWKSGDTGERAYREVEREFVEEHLR